MLRLRDEALTALLRSSHLCLATYRRDGREVRTPVWFAEANGALYVYTHRETGKLKRLRHTSRVRIACCSMLGKVRGPWFDTRARILDDAAETDLALAALLGRYGLLMRFAGWTAALIGRLGERRFIRITLPADDAGGGRTDGLNVQP